MGAEIARLQRKRRNAWQRVTNALVMTFADKDCERCGGHGMFTANGGGEVAKPFMCVCTDEPFKKAYEGRLRRTKEGRLEYRPLVLASLLDVAEGAEATGTGIHEKVTRDE